jgi:Putative beta barrel porin-7 (BBP7)
VRSTCLAVSVCAVWLALAPATLAQNARLPVAARPAPAAQQPAAEALPPAIASDRAYYDPGEPILGQNYFSPSCGPAGCNFCGSFGESGCGPCGCDCLGGLYVRAEYLAWAARGMNLPPLITTSPQGTARTDAGVLDADNTTILFGGGTAGSNLRSGGRITIGRWFDPCQRLGVEADYFAIADETTRFQQTSSGNPILARPFFDVTLGQESAELVAFPNVISGTTAAEHVTRFQGAGVRALYNLACGDGCGTSCITHCPVPTGYRFDLILGYRFLRLDDRVDVVEDLTSLDTSAGTGAFLLRDHFQTRNDFHGADFGTAIRFCKGCWTIDFLSKLALGNTRSVINIDGSTIITQQGQAQTFQGGLLAQRTNIGSFTADEFAVVPELGLTLGYRINPCWRVTFGYTFLYWSRVARAGDQISRDLNPNLLPPEDPTVTTNLRPEFHLTYADDWVQGMNVGLEGKW